MKKILIFSFIVLIFSMCKNNTSQNNGVTSENDSAQYAEPIEVVKLFVESLGKKDFQTAYNLQKNDNWGTFNDFSSIKAFGGINKTSINEIKKLPDEKGKSVIFVDAYYYDPVNGDNRFKEKFYLQKFSNEWKITDLKIVKIVSNKSKNTDFEKFIGLFKNCSLPYPDKFYSEAGKKKIPNEDVKKYITSNADLFVDFYDYVLAEGKFKINEDYYGIILHFFSDGDAQNETYLFIFKNDGTYKSNLQLYYYFHNGNNGHVYTSEIDTKYNIKKTSIDTYIELAGDTIVDKKIENYVIKSGIITKK